MEKTEKSKPKKIGVCQGDKKRYLIHFKCFDLPRVMLSNPSTYIEVTITFRKDLEMRYKDKVFKTEVVHSSKNPNYEKSVEYLLCSCHMHNIYFRVFHRTKIGFNDDLLAGFVQNVNQMMQIPLYQSREIILKGSDFKKATKSNLSFLIQPISDNSREITILAKCFQLEKEKTALLIQTRYDPMLRFYKKCGDEWLLAYETNVVKSSSHPVFQEFSIQTNRLAEKDNPILNNKQGIFKVQVWANDGPDGNHQVKGEAYFDFYKFLEKEMAEDYLMSKPKIEKNLGQKLKSLNPFAKKKKLKKAVAKKVGSIQLSICFKSWADCETLVEEVLCPEGHPLTVYNCEKTEYSCDGCQKLYSVGGVLRRCSQCDWDCCQKCFIKLENGEPLIKPKEEKIVEANQEEVKRNLIITEEEEKEQQIEVEKKVKEVVKVVKENIEVKPKEIVIIQVPKPPEETPEVEEEKVEEQEEQQQEEQQQQPKEEEVKSEQDEEESDDEVPVIHTKEEKLEIITQKKEDLGYVRSKDKGYEQKGSKHWDDFEITGLHKEESEISSIKVGLSKRSRIVSLQANYRTTEDKEDICEGHLIEGKDAKKKDVQVVEVEFTPFEELYEITMFMDFQGIKGLRFHSNIREQDVGDVTMQQEFKLINNKEGEQRKIVAIGGGAKKRVTTLFGYFKAQYEGQQDIEIGK